jgi:hypothetical protein
LSRPSSSLLLCGFFLACLSLDTIPDAYISWACTINEMSCSSGILHSIVRRILPDPLEA